MRAYVTVRRPASTTQGRWHVYGTIDHGECAVMTDERYFPAAQKEEAEAYARELLQALRGGYLEWT